MNEIENKYLLTGNKFIPEMHVRQSGFTYRACGPFTKNPKKTKKEQQFKETGTSRHIYQNKLDKGCFQYDVANKEFEDLAGITASLKCCVIKHLILPKMQIYNGYQRGFALMVYKFLVKKLLVKE